MLSKMISAKLGFSSMYPFYDHGSWAFTEKGDYCTANFFENINATFDEIKGDVIKDDDFKVS